MISRKKNCKRHHGTTYICLNEKTFREIKFQSSISPEEDYLEKEVAFTKFLVKTRNSLSPPPKKYFVKSPL